MPFYRCTECGDIRHMEAGNDYICNQCGGNRELMRPEPRPKYSSHPSKATKNILDAIAEAIDFKVIGEVDGMQTISVSMRLHDAFDFARENGEIWAKMN
jgi:DNA-directed RNA polymerase subunit RPC12/RpoP